MDAITRFARKIGSPTETGCIEWIASTNEGGYGQFWYAGRYRKAHRWAYEHHFGPIAEGLAIDHLCRNRRCVNIAHLEIVTVAENNRRSLRWAVRPTHCPAGHPYDEANTRIRRGCRSCRACDRDRHRQLREATL